MVRRDVLHCGQKLMTRSSSPLALTPSEGGFNFDDSPKSIHAHSAQQLAAVNTRPLELFRRTKASHTDIERQRAADLHAVIDLLQERKRTLLHKSISYSPLRMKLTLRTAAPADLELRLPMGGGTASVAYVTEHYPEFAAEMDGADYGACLELYYERNPVNGIYEFRDQDAELDIAEAMGMDLRVCTEGESTAEKKTRRAAVPR